MTIPVAHCIRLSCIVWTSFVGESVLNELQILFIFHVNQSNLVHKLKQFDWLYFLTYLIITVRDINMCYYVCLLFLFLW